MPIFDGKTVLLALGNGATPTENFTQIGGLKTIQMRLKNHIVENNTVSGGRWRTVLEGGGIAALTISGSGSFTDSAAEDSLRQAALSAIIHNYQLTFGNGDTIAGAFTVAQYVRMGGMDGEESFEVMLESAGEINYNSVG